ncbi:MAG: hypothetical protein FIA92_08225 [Chloroflexi bacterium]|nr:hypothetical protein [Chloroflexota bacterium]
MAEVVSIVTGTVSSDGLQQVADAYRSGLSEGPPPEIEETFLLEADGGRVAILSVWHRRSGLEAMIASGEEPFARRVIREAGGSPEVTVYRIVQRAGSDD